VLNRLENRPAMSEGKLPVEAAILEVERFREQREEAQRRGGRAPISTPQLERALATIEQARREEEKMPKIGGGAADDNVAEVMVDAPTET
jgi:hypothetical protein